MTSPSGSTSRSGSPIGSRPSDMSNCPNLVKPDDNNGESLDPGRLDDEQLNAVCSVLYYDSNIYLDRNIRDISSPLQVAVWEGNVEMATIVIDFYDDTYFNQEISGVENIGCQLLLDCLTYNCDATIFKLVWHRINHDDLDDDHFHFLLYRAVRLVAENRFVAAHCLDCLYLILSKFNLPALKFCKSWIKQQFADFFTLLFEVFSRKNVQQEDRLRITNICLSLGIPVTWNDYDFVYNIYRFGNEFEALIYGVNYLEGLGPSCQNSVIFMFFCHQKYILLIPYQNILGMHSLSIENKQRIQFHCVTRYGVDTQQRILKELDRIPEFPTLFELCRNQIRKSIFQSYKYYPYQYHDAIKNLNLPENICDIIRMKTKLYY